MRWLFPIMIVSVAAVCAFVVTLPASAASPAAPSAGVCDPEDAGNRYHECRKALEQNLPAPTPAPAPVVSNTVKSALPFTYAYVMTSPVALYANPADADNGVAPVRTLDHGYLWVRLAGQVAYNGQTWYLTDGGGYLPASLAGIYRPSTFQGIAVSSQPEFPFAWVLKSIKTSSKPGGQPGASSATFKRYDVVNIYESSVENGQVWYRVGDNQWLVQTAVAKVQVAPPPPGVGSGEKWIEVNLFEQTVAAYEGDRMVYATLGSTGLPRWATVQGLFRIYAKVTLGPMSGQEGKPDYYSLEDVPWAMYFYQGYSLHGAYWHDGFGYQHSHGCVNLAPLDARWLFDWTTPAVAQGGGGKLATPADLGTWVWVHD
jgi:hypothetical protein